MSFDNSVPRLSPRGGSAVDVMSGCPSTFRSFQMGFIALIPHPSPPPTPLPTANSVPNKFFGGAETKSSWKLHKISDLTYSTCSSFRFRGHQIGKNDLKHLHCFIEARCPRPRCPFPDASLPDDPPPRCPPSHLLPPKKTEQHANCERKKQKNKESKSCTLFTCA